MTTSLPNFMQSKATSGFKVLAFLLYAEVPGMTKHKDGTIEITDMANVGKYISGNSSMVRVYLQQLEFGGIAKDVVFGRNTAKLKLNKPEGLW